MTTIYLVTHKVPEYDIEENIDSFGSLTKANAFYLSKIKSIKLDHPDEHARCDLRKITLSDKLTTKQLMLALISRKGYAEKTEEIKDWSQN
jgi:hypothetical protein